MLHPPLLKNQPWRQALPFLFHKYLSVKDHLIKKQLQYSKGKKDIMLVFPSPFYGRLALFSCIYPAWIRAHISPHWLPYPTLISTWLWKEASVHDLLLPMSSWGEARSHRRSVAATAGLRCQGCPPFLAAEHSALWKRAIQIQTFLITFSKWFKHCLSLFCSKCSFSLKRTNLFPLGQDLYQSL